MRQCVTVTSVTVIFLSSQTHQWKAYLFSFQMMFESQFQTFDPCDWVCGPGSHTHTRTHIFNGCPGHYTGYTIIIVVIPQVTLSII